MYVTILTHDFRLSIGNSLPPSIILQSLQLNTASSSELPLLTEPAALFRLSRELLPSSQHCFTSQCSPEQTNIINTTCKQVPFFLEIRTSSRFNIIINWNIFPFLQRYSYTIIFRLLTCLSDPSFFPFLLAGLVINQADIVMTLSSFCTLLSWHDLHKLTQSKMFRWI